MNKQNQPPPGAPGQPARGNAPTPRGNAPAPRGNAPIDELAHTVADREAPPEPALSTDKSSARIEVAGHIGRYAVLRRLGEGGMGVVFAAYDEELDRKVAVKLLRDSGPISPERRTRILREAQAMARVSHPNVVNVYEVGEVNGQVFIAMEFVEGTTLSEWQSAGRRWEEILNMYIAAGEGLHAAHQAGLVHRDFKPDNVLVGSEGRPRVADFGLARSDDNPALDEHLKKEAAEAAAASAQAPPVSILRSPLTVAGTILGTPAYMSPENMTPQLSDGDFGSIGVGDCFGTDGTSRRDARMQARARSFRCECCGPERSPLDSMRCASMSSRWAGWEGWEGSRVPRNRVLSWQEP